MSNDLAQTAITLAAGLVTIVVFMAVCLLISIKQQKLTVVDTAWGLGFVLVAGVSAALGSGSGVRFVLLAMVAIWGMRLAWHLHTRNSKQAEDPRYQDLSDRSAGSFTRTALTRVFLPQGVSMWLVATPVMVGVNNEDYRAWLVVFGVVVWSVGFGFEAVGDWQLKEFKADPAHKGQLMDRGLWRYTRHPNYFGDACLWFGIWIVAAGSWAGLATVISPIAMYVFLTRVTGAALNEKGMKTSKPGYEDYVRRTSGFFPLPPRRR